MTTPAEDFAPLGHMLEASGWALSIAEGRTRHDLDLDLQLFLVLSRAIEVVGEAANRVSDDTQGRTPEIPWRRIIGMRNHLAHKYDDINYDILWEVVTLHLTPMIENVRRLLPDGFTPTPIRAVPLR